MSDFNTWVLVVDVAVIVLAAVGAVGFLVIYERRTRREQHIDRPRRRDPVLADGHRSRGLRRLRAAGSQTMPSGSRNRNI
jgi:hypothetical protein